MTELLEFKNEEAKECFTKMIRHYKQSFRYLIEGDVEKCVEEVYDWENFKQEKHRTEGIRKTKEFQEKLESQIVEMNKISKKSQRIGKKGQMKSRK